MHPHGFSPLAKIVLVSSHRGTSKAQVITFLNEIAVVQYVYMCQRCQAILTDGRSSLWELYQLKLCPLAATSNRAGSFLFELAILVASKLKQLPVSGLILTFNCSRHCVIVYSVASQHIQQSRLDALGEGSSSRSSGVKPFSRRWGSAQYASLT